MNKSASLTAGVCSLCITASLVAVPPQASAAELPAIGHRTVSMVDQPYELTASSQIDNLLLVAGIPFNNLNTTLTTLGGLTNFVTGLNLALGNIYKGNWDLVQANLQKAWNDEVAAFSKVLALPQTLINYDVKTIQNFLAGLSGASATLATTNKAVAAATPTATATPSVNVNNLLVVLGIPFNNLNTALTTLGGLTNFVTGLNLALGNIYKGNWDLVPANLQKAWNDEVKAFQKVLALPQTLINYDVKAIQNLFTPAAATSTFVTSARVQTLALPAATSAIEAGKTTAEEATTGTETKSTTDTKGSTPAAGTEVKDTTEVKDSTEVKDATDTKGTSVTSGTEGSTAKDESGTTSDSTPASDTDKTGTKAGDKTADKAGDKDATDAADGKGSATGKQATGKKGSTYGKHARQDDGTGSTASASTGTSTTSSTGGRHRKPEGGGSEGSSSSASSAGGSSAAA
ncbi:hypothetical protein ACXPWS_25070 [Mycobacterium sp. BMJ-28]